MGLSCVGEEDSNHRVLNHLPKKRLQLQAGKGGGDKQEARKGPEQVIQARTVNVQSAVLCTVL